MWELIVELHMVTWESEVYFVRKRQAALLSSLFLCLKRTVVTVTRTCATVGINLKAVLLLNAHLGTSNTRKPSAQVSHCHLKCSNSLRASH